jgi:lactate dehydrogenase-like 2-hydroxyacid dehydrogenase
VDFEVLMLSEGMKEIGTRIESRAILHRLWREPDGEAALARIAPNIRAIAGTWHAPKIDASLMSKLPQLEIVSSFGVGYDHVDAAWAGAHGIVVTHTPGVLDAETADTAMALALMAVRRYPQAERHLRAGHWPSGPFPLSASLRGRTMGILGLGRIGKEIAKRARAFGVDVVYHGRKPQDDAPYLYYPSLLSMAKACDILVISAPGGATTRKIVDREVLEALGPNGVLVNIARGSLVDEAALIEALASGKILAAGLDVYENEPQVPEALMKLDNAVLLPHVGSASGPTRLAMANLVVDNLFSWMDGKGPLTPVPETPWPR